MTTTAVKALAPVSHLVITTMACGVVEAPPRGAMMTTMTTYGVLPSTIGALLRQTRGEAVLSGVTGVRDGAVMVILHFRLQSRPPCRLLNGVHQSTATTGRHPTIHHQHPNQLLSLTTHLLPSLLKLVASMVLLVSALWSSPCRSRCSI